MFKEIFIIGVAVCASTCAHAYEGEGRNYALHATVAYSIAQLSSHVMKDAGMPRIPRAIFSSGIAAIAGAAKEMTDAQPSMKDLAADGIGAAVSAGFVVGFDW